MNEVAHESHAKLAFKTRYRSRLANTSLTHRGPGVDEPRSEPHYVGINAGACIELLMQPPVQIFVFLLGVNARKVVPQGIASVTRRIPVSSSVKQKPTPTAWNEKSFRMLNNYQYIAWGIKLHVNDVRTSFR